MIKLFSSNSLSKLLELLASKFNTKVDKITGKGLSTEDYTTDEKSKLSSISPNANNYELPTATTTTIGGVKVDGSTINISNGTISGNHSNLLPLDGSRSMTNQLVIGTTSTTTFTGVSTIRKTTSKGVRKAGFFVNTDGTSKFLNADSSKDLASLVFDNTSLTYIIGQYDTGKKNTVYHSGNLSGATTSTEGLMSSLDKTKLDGIATGANNYTLPTASESILGGVKVDGSTITISDGVISSTPPGEVSGNAGTATKLQSSRTVTLSGDVTGSFEFDGSSNITVNTTVGDDSHNHVIGNIDGLQTALDAKVDTTSLSSVATSGSYNDLTNKPTSYTLPTASTTTLGGVKVDGSTVTISNGVISSPAQTTITGNAGSATKLQTARTISLSGGASGSASFDGSANVSIPVNINKTTVSATIGTTWSGSAVPYTQSITVTGALSTSSVEVSISPLATKEQVEAYQNLNWTDGGQTTNSITIKAWGIKNTIDIPIVISYSNGDNSTPSPATEYALTTYVDTAIPLYVDTAISNNNTTLNAQIGNRADKTLSNLGSLTTVSSNLNTLGIRVVVETYSDSSGNWYRIYNDKWCEQGGTYSWSGAWTTKTLNKPFANTNYCFVGTGARTDNSPYQGFLCARDYTTTSVNIWFSDDTTSNPSAIRWYACGYTS